MILWKSCVGKISHVVESIFLASKTLVIWLWFFSVLKMSFCSWEQKTTQKTCLATCFCSQFWKKKFKKWGVFENNKLLFSKTVSYSPSPKPDHTSHHLPTTHHHCLHHSSSFVFIITHCHNCCDQIFTSKATLHQRNKLLFHPFVVTWRETSLTIASSMSSLAIVVPINCHHHQHLSLPSSSLVFCSSSLLWFSATPGTGNLIAIGAILIWVAAVHRHLKRNSAKRRCNQSVIQPPWAHQYL